MLKKFFDYIAQKAKPTEKWRILQSDLHSTVWNGKDLLFDANFLAKKIKPDECFAMAICIDANPVEFPVGAWMKFDGEEKC